jgi:Predicted membrane protein
MKIKKILALIVFIIIAGSGISLVLKANIGVGAWDALATVGANLFNIKIGTVGIILNISCVFFQIVLLRKDFKLMQLLQIIISFALGSIINFVLYDLLGGFNVEANYLLQMTLFIVGIVVCSFAVAAIMVLDIITLPLEGACSAVSSITKKSFPVLRQLVDVISIVIVLIATFTLNLDPIIREGTILAMLVFGPLLGIFMKVHKNIFKKMNLID